MPQESKNPLNGFINSPAHRSLRELFLDFNFSMSSCWYWFNRPPWGVPRRICSDSFFLFPVFGEVYVQLDRHPRTLLSPGRFVMLPEGVPHALELKEGYKKLEQVSIHCQIHDRWGRPLLRRFPRFFGQVTDRIDLVRKLKELTCLMSTDAETGQFYAETLLKELLAAQIRAGTVLKLSSQADPRVEAVIRRMEQEWGAANLSIEKLAEGVKITSAQLRNIFRKAAGVGPKRFLNTLRLRKATQLLLRTTATVKEVARDSGFASDHYFHLAFRARFGCTPSEYRKKAHLEV